MNKSLEDFRKGAKESLLEFYGLKESEKLFGLFLVMGISSFVIGILLVFTFIRSDTKSELILGIFFLVLGTILGIISNANKNKLAKVNYYMKKEINNIKNAKDLLVFLSTIEVAHFSKILYFHEWVIWLSILKPYAKRKHGEPAPEKLSVFPDESLESLGQIANYLYEEGINFNIKDILTYSNPKSVESDEPTTLIIHKDNPRKLLQLLQKGCEAEGKVKLVFKKPII